MVNHFLKAVPQCVMHFPSTPDNFVSQFIVNYFVHISIFFNPVNPLILQILIQTFYSYLKLSTGFLVAAFHD